jgi:hypothetical protein
MSAVERRKRPNSARCGGFSLMWLVLLLLALVIQFRPDAALAAGPDAKTAANAADGVIVITGSVVDRESKRPIESFRVIPGIHLHSNRDQWR